ncbi:hypothetical protein ACA910_008934 [Epithemia clementina (nom. ined.)]
MTSAMIIRTTSRASSSSSRLFKAVSLTSSPSDRGILTKRQRHNHSFAEPTTLNDFGGDAADDVVSSSSSDSEPSLNASHFGYRTVSPLKASRYTCTERLTAQKDTVSVLGDIFRAGYYNEGPEKATGALQGWNRLLDEEQQQAKKSFQADSSIHGTSHPCLLNELVQNEWHKWNGSSSDHSSMEDHDGYYEPEF